MKKFTELNISNLANEYILDKQDWRFEALYFAVQRKYKAQLVKWVGSTSSITEHEVYEVFEETLLRVVGDIEKNGGSFDKLFHRALFNRFKSLLRKVKHLRETEQYEFEQDDDDSAKVELADEFRFEENIGIKKEADQRQLIDYLLNGADATTTAIVETFLAHPKPTATAIAKELGVHHSKVLRKLEKLAGKFDSKQFGDYRDYLVAL